MRLIDADELLGIERLVSIGARSQDAKVLMEQVLFDIQEMPTIDAVPVEHWKSTSFLYVKDVDEYKDRIILDEGDKTKRCKVYYADDPAAHGHWQEDCTWIICSECGAEYKDEIIFMNRNQDYEKPKFCPNCGAKMDGDPHDSGQ